MYIVTVVQLTEQMFEFIRHFSGVFLSIQFEGNETCNFLYVGTEIHDIFRTRVEASCFIKAIQNYARQYLKNICDIMFMTQVDSLSSNSKCFTSHQ